MERYRNYILGLVVALLAWGFWESEDFTKLASGLALFMFGMLSLERGFQAFTGGVLESVLETATRTRIRSLGFGVVTTALMQSSSLVSLITISFLSAGIIGLSQGIGIIFGSNIGTTTGAWLMASYGVKFDLATYALPMAVFGILFIYQKDNVLKGVGQVLLGIAFLFIGIQFIKEGFETLSQGFDLTEFSMEGFLGVLTYTLIGIVLTIVMQSSHAVLMLTIAALSAEQVSYFNALALAIGSNIGTTITAVLGALGSNAAGKRLAGAHMIFNLTVGALAIIFIGPLASLVDLSVGFLGIAEDNYTMKLATFHTIFNILGVILMMPLIGRLVLFLEERVRDEVVIDGVEQPLFLTDESIVEYPDAALVALTSETRHLALNVILLLADTLGLKAADIRSDEPMEKVVARSRTIPKFRFKDVYRRKIKSIYGAILEFSSKARPRMEEEQAERLFQLQTASRHLVEIIKLLQLVRKNIATYIGGDNEYMRAHYDEWRVEFGSYLRLISRLSDETDIEKINTELEAFSNAVRGAETGATERINELIRSGKITPAMGVSLLNDLSAHREISDALVKAAIIIFSATRTTGYLDELDEAAIAQIEKLHAESPLPRERG